MLYLATVSTKQLRHRDTFFLFYPMQNYFYEQTCFIKNPNCVVLFVLISNNDVLRVLRSVPTAFNFSSWGGRRAHSRLIFFAAKRKRLMLMTSFLVLYLKFQQNMVK